MAGGGRKREEEEEKGRGKEDARFFLSPLFFFPQS